jgi:FtsH-binding integral membrane protein
MRRPSDFQNDPGTGAMRIDSSMPLTDTSGERVSAFLRSVYGWMFVGLGVTATVAYGVASSPSVVEAILYNPVLFWVIVIAQLGLVFFLSFKVNDLAQSTAAGLFILYSALTGVTSSVILLAYTGASVASAFLITAGMFGATSLFGLTTKRNLAGAGQFFFMGLIGLVLASILGLFWQSDALQFTISIIGVIVFTGLAAWDSQRLKRMALAVPHDRVGSFAVVGALALYLDFINLFFSLLRLTGSRRE